ncbi:MAG TPA: hypothetical protein P5274_01780, partial [Candidatus Paceibacterota bacterium]|nr:hypothetical protein [Candidatus Paceibacterota bacterium]
MNKLRKILTLLIFGFLGGVTLASFVSWPLPWLGLFFVLALSFLILFFILGRSKLFLVLFIIFVGAILGLVRFSLTQNDSVYFPDCSSPAEPCVGLIVADPDRRDASTRLV